MDSVRLSSVSVAQGVDNSTRLRRLNPKTQKPTIRFLMFKLKYGLLVGINNANLTALFWKQLCKDAEFCFRLYLSLLAFRFSAKKSRSNDTYWLAIYSMRNSFSCSVHVCNELGGTNKSREFNWTVKEVHFAIARMVIRGVSFVPVALLQP